MDHPRHPRPKYALRPSKLCAPPVELAGCLAEQFARLPRASTAQPPLSRANAARATSGLPLRKDRRQRSLQPQPDKEIDICKKLSSFLPNMKVGGRTLARLRNETKAGTRFSGWKKSRVDSQRASAAAVTRIGSQQHSGLSARWLPPRSLQEAQLGQTPLPSLNASVGLLFGNRSAILAYPSSHTDGTCACSTRAPLPSFRRPVRGRPSLDSRTGSLPTKCPRIGGEFSRFSYLTPNLRLRVVFGCHAVVTVS